MANPQQPKLGTVYSFTDSLANRYYYEDLYLIKPNLLLILKANRYEFLDISDPKELRILSQHPIQPEQLIIGNYYGYPSPVIIQQNNQQLIFSLNQRHIDIFDIGAARPKHLSMFDLGRDIGIWGWKGSQGLISAQFMVHQQRLYTLYPDALGSVRIWDISQPSQPKQLAIWTSSDFRPQRLLLHPTQAKAHYQSAAAISETKIIHKIEWLDMTDPAQPIVFHEWQYEQPSNFAKNTFIWSLPMALLPETNTLAVGLGDKGVVFLR